MEVQDHGWLGPGAQDDPRSALHEWPVQLGMPLLWLVLLT